jgi:hypothetical protein
MVLKSLTFYLGVDQEKKKAGRRPKVSDLVRRWEEGITLLAYLYGYAIGCSFFRKSQIWG